MSLRAEAARNKVTKQSAKQPRRTKGYGAGLRYLCKKVVAAAGFEPATKGSTISCPPKNAHEITDSPMKF